MVHVPWGDLRGAPLSASPHVRSGTYGCLECTANGERVMKIDFDGIQAFVAVAELGAFHKAADQLHLTQTALTRRIQKLEALLGARLIERTTRQMTLTALGREFLPAAQALVQETTRAVRQLKERTRRSGSHFTLACVPTMATQMLPTLMREYAQRHADYRIRLIDASGYEIREVLLNQQAEMGISIQGPKHPDLVETALFDDPLMFFCRDNHPLRRQKSVRWAEMNRDDLIVVSNFTATRIVTDYQLARRGIRLEGRFEVQHHATALNLVAAGVGCAILPASTCGEGDRPGVVRIPLGAPVVKRKIVLLERRGHTLSPAATAFRSLLLRKSQ